MENKSIRSLYGRVFAITCTIIAVLPAPHWLHSCGKLKHIAILLIPVYKSSSRTLFPFPVWYWLMLLAVVNDEFTQTDEKQINFNQKRRKWTHHYYMAAIFFGDRISMMFMDIFESIITMIRILFELHNYKLNVTQPWFKIITLNWPLISLRSPFIRSKSAKNYQLLFYSFLCFRNTSRNWMQNSLCFFAIDFKFYVANKFVQYTLETTIIYAKIM